jgi:hypothetical protein
MDLIKNILIDSLNGFSAKDIPLFIFQILIAGILAHLVQLVLNKKWKESVVCNSALIAVVLAVLTSIVKYSLPFAVMGLAAVLLFKNNKEESTISKIGLLIVSIIGVGCGIGSVIQTIIGVIFILLIIMFTPLKNNE